jgi:hypothetical protein
LGGLEGTEGAAGEEVRVLILFAFASSFLFLLCEEIVEEGLAREADAGEEVVCPGGGLCVCVCVCVIFDGVRY